MIDLLTPPNLRASKFMILALSMSSSPHFVSAHAGAKPQSKPSQICERHRGRTMNVQIHYTDSVRSTRTASARYRCGPNGYPIGYGLKYCEKCKAAQSVFPTRSNMDAKYYAMFARCTYSRSHGWCGCGRNVRRVEQ